MRVFAWLVAIFSLAAAAEAQTGPATAVATPALPPGTESLERDGYAQLHVTVRITGSQALGFGGCPKSSYAGVDFDNLLKGDQTYTLGLKIETPSALPPLLLTPVQIEHDSGIFGEKCRMSFSEIDFLSPLFFVDQFRGRTFTVTPTITRRIKWSDNFRQAVSGALDAAKAFSGIPAPALSSGLTLFDRIAAQQGDDDVVASGRPLMIIEGPIAQAQPWNIAEAEGPMPKIEITAKLVPVDSLFAGAQNPNYQTLLGSSFPVREPPPLFGVYLRSLPAIQTLLGAQNVDQFSTACLNARYEVAALGLDFGDQALAMWALAREHPALGQNPLVDATPCMQAVFAASPTDSQSRPVISPRPIEANGGPPTADQMRLAVTQDLATFLTDGDWPRRRAAAERFLAARMRYADPADLRLVKVQNFTFENVDQWYVQSQAANEPLATRFGCLTYRPGTALTATQPATESRALAVATFNTRDGAGVVQARDAIVRLTFAATKPGETARVSSLEITPSPSTEEIAAIRDNPANALGCGQGWRPTLIFPS